MINLLNDYNGACATEILEELIKTNSLKTSGYSTDEYCLEAITKIREMVCDSEATVHFLVGGTQTNLVLLSTLKPYEAVVSCDTGHIACHETGAIENTGHKVIVTKNNNSKIDIVELERVIEEHDSFHMVKPKLVYISNSTEYGSVYTKHELEVIRDFCDKNNMYLFLDGARLCHALASETNDLSLADIYRLTDAFYIGGTKNGLLFGEALIIRNKNIAIDLKYNIKQKGALLAKGRLLGIMFNRLFKDELYLNLASHANMCAIKLKNIFKKYNIEIYNENDTNLLFVYLDDDLKKYLEKYVVFDFDIKDRNRKVYRFVTSYNTDYNEILEIDNILSKYKNKQMA